MRPLSLSQRLLAVSFVALSLGACARQDRMVTGSVTPPDVRARHPIVLANAPRTLDIFIAGERALDDRQKEDVRDFAKGYRADGSGVIQILMPRGAGQEAGAHRALAVIRETLSAAGVRGGVSVGSYAVADPRLAAPIRLVYSALEAKTSNRCGEWPDDLAAAGAKAGWDNRPYYNFGCSYQQNLAAQVANPIDLVRPRHMDPADSQMRVRAITAVREGRDPGTEWNFQPSPIGAITP